MISLRHLAVSALSVLIFGGPVAGAADDETELVETPRRAPDGVPDLRDEDIDLKVQKRDFVIVPVPISDPTIGTGLVLGGAYFYRQTEAQKAVQPPSVTGAAGLYTDSDTYAYAIGHQSYWSENKWRLNAIVGHGNLNLRFEANFPGRTGLVDWVINGNFFNAKIARRFAGDWYIGGFTRVIDVDQEFSVAIPVPTAETDTKEIGLGVYVEYDNRDKPMNTYSGNYFEAEALFNSDKFGGNSNYESFSANYRSFHQLSESMVLAWELEGCSRSDQTPLWDACRINLRGFNATRYMGERSASGQAEFRWRFWRKFGAVAFAGAGTYSNVFTDFLDDDIVESYGVGLRYMLLESQRVNLRVDYARSGGSDAVYLSVGESF